MIKGLEKNGDRWERRVEVQKRLGRPYFSSLEVWGLQGLTLEEQGDWASERYPKIFVRDEVNLSKESWGGR